MKERVSAISINALDLPAIEDKMIHQIMFVLSNRLLVLGCEFVWIDYLASPPLAP